MTILAACRLRLAIIGLVSVGLLSFVGQTYAHPLGNFTVSHYARLEIAADRIDVRYVVDLAELSTFQEFALIDTNGNRAPDKEELEQYGQRMAPQYAQGLQLTIDGTPLPLRVVEQQVMWQAGEGGLPNLRVECDFVGDLTQIPANVTHRLRLQDLNRRERSGWHEIVVLPHFNISVFDSTAFGNGVTDELKAYPKDPLASMLNEQRAELSFQTGVMPAGAVALQTRDGRKAEPQPRSQRAGLTDLSNFPIKVGLLGLLLAALLGFFVIRGKKSLEPIAKGD